MSLNDIAKANQQCTIKQTRLKDIKMAGVDQQYINYLTNIGAASVIYANGPSFDKKEIESLVDVAILNKNLNKNDILSSSNNYKIINTILSIIKQSAANVDKDGIKLMQFHYPEQLLSYDDAVSFVADTIAYDSLYKTQNKILTQFDASDWVLNPRETISQNTKDAWKQASDQIDDSRIKSYDFWSNTKNLLLCGPNIDKETNLSQKPINSVGAFNNMLILNNYKNDGNNNYTKTNMCLYNPNDTNNQFVSCTKNSTDFDFVKRGNTNMTINDFLQKYAPDSKCVLTDTFNIHCFPKYSDPK